MKKESSFRAHSACLTALFILGNAVISMPFLKKSKSALLVLLLAALIAAIGMLALKRVFLFLNSKFFARPTARPLILIAFFGFTLFSFLSAAASARDYINFAKTSILPDCPRWLLSLVFAAVLYVFASCKNRSILKFALISAVFIAAVLIFFFILSLRLFDWHNIYFRFSLSASFFADVLSGAARLLLPLSIPMVFLLLSQENTALYGVNAGLYSGVALLSVSLLNALLIFGSEAVSQMGFPYADAISTVSVGSIFTRMDGFAYFVFFICALIKAAVCLKSACLLLQSINICFQKWVLAAGAGMVFVWSFI